MPVSVFPALTPPLALFPRKGGGLSSGLPQGARLHTFYMARCAIWHAVRSISPIPGDRALVPAYNCGVEIAAIQAAGLEVDFYRVDAEMRIDPADVERRAGPRTKVLLATHYYGFPQSLAEIADLCRRRGILLIEDCAHMVPRTPRGGGPGATGDFVVFSLPKCLPAPNGAVLWSRRRDGRAPALKQPATSSVLRRVALLTLDGFRARGGILAGLERAARGAARGALAAARQSSLGRTLAEQNPATAQFDLRLVDYDMADWSKRIVDGLDMEEITRRRLTNYEYLEERLARAVPAKLRFALERQGACPAFFPVRAPNRDRLEGGLAGQGIETFVFGKVGSPLIPPNEFFEARTLSDTILGLPVHQDLTPRDLERVSEATIRCISP